MYTQLDCCWYNTRQRRSINMGAQNEEIFSPFLFGMMFGYRYVLLFFCAAGYFGSVFGEKIPQWHPEVLRIIQDPSNSDFINSINELEHNFQAYDADVDRAIPWLGLKEAMKALENLRVNYTGSLTADLIDVEETVDKLMNEYRLTTNDMFRWAVSGRDRLNFICDNDDWLTDNMPKIKEFAQFVLDEGNKTLDTTLQKLNEISKSLIDLGNSLKRLKANLMAELRTLNEEFEEYEKLREKFNINLEAERVRESKLLEECHVRQKMIEESIKSSEKTAWIILGIGGLLATILTGGIAAFGFAVTAGVVGTAVGVATIGASTYEYASSPNEVSCAHAEASYHKISLAAPMVSREEQKEILNNYYKALGNALENAIGNVSSVREAMNDEINYVEEIYGILIERSGASQLMKADFYARMFKSLKQLAAKLDGYVQRHSNGVVLEANRKYNGKRRRRRQDQLRLPAMVELDMEYAEMTKAIEAQLNATENERNKRFWNLDYSGGHLRNVVHFQMHDSMKFNIA